MLGAALGTFDPGRCQQRPAIVGARRRQPGPNPSRERVIAVSTALALAGPAGRYVHWGVILISVTNLAVIGLMVVLFVLALLLPFPGGRSHGRGRRTP